MPDLTSAFRPLTSPSLAVFSLLFCTACSGGAQIRDLKLTPDPKKVSLRVDAALTAPAEAGKLKAVLRISALNGDTTAYPKPSVQTISFPKGRQAVLYSQTVSGWETSPFWRVNTPFDPAYRAPLHRLTLTMLRGKKTLQKLERDFVLGSVKSSEKGYFLNGELIPLKQWTLTGKEPLETEAVSTYLRRGVTVLKASEVPFTEKTLRLFRRMGMIGINPDGVGDAGGTRFRAATPIPSARLAEVEPLEKDTQTQGNWLGVYGKQAFYVPLPDGASVFAVPGLSLSRAELDFRVFGKGEALPDPRLPLSAPGSTLRYPHAFSSMMGSPAVFFVKTNDERKRVLSLYLLDFSRRKEELQVQILDSTGYLLSETTVSALESGRYLRYRFSGDLTLLVKSLKFEFSPTVWGLFLDPLPPK